MLKVEILDDDLSELILKGKNNGRVERLLFKETEDGIKISLIEINENHYGNKK